MYVGEVLSDIHLDYRGVTLHSIITTKSVKQLSLKVGEPVFGMVKSNEIMLKPL
jgi:molybdopterin-binding protein